MSARYALKGNTCPVILPFPKPVLTVNSYAEQDTTVSAGTHTTTAMSSWRVLTSVRLARLASAPSSQTCAPGSLLQTRSGSSYAKKDQQHNKNNQNKNNGQKAAIALASATALALKVLYDEKGISLQAAAAVAAITGMSSAQISALAGSVSAGSSIASVASSFGGYEFSVAFKLELENYTNDHLSVYQNKYNDGHVSKPPVDIKPGIKEAMSGHKVSNTATGCSGTASWTIGNKRNEKMLVVMYSIPFDQNFHSNYCAVGIFDKRDTTDFFKLMYKETEQNFKRKEFYRDADPAIYYDSNYIVTATMGSNHKPEIQVRLYPKSVDNLANKLCGEGISFK